jgi:hypothetical protein
MMITGKQLKALSKICSKDSARGAITCVAVRPQGDISATDGHMMVCLEHKLDISETLYIDSQDTKRIAASDVVQIQATQGILVTPKNGNPYLINYVTDVGDFPKISEVIPKQKCVSESAKDMVATLRDLEDTLVESDNDGYALGKSKMAVTDCVNNLPESKYAPYFETPVLNGQFMANAFAMIATFASTGAILATEIRTHGSMSPLEISFTVGELSGYCLVMPIRAEDKDRAKMKFRPMAG